MDTFNGNYHLTGLSPCIDTGRSVGAPSDDMNGDSRPQGTGVDIGADEFDPSAPPITTTTTALTTTSSIPVTTTTTIPFRSTTLNNTLWKNLTYAEGEMYFGFSGDYLYVLPDYDIICEFSFRDFGLLSPFSTDYCGDNGIFGWTSPLIGIGWLRWCWEPFGSPENCKKTIFLRKINNNWTPEY